MTLTVALTTGQHYRAACDGPIFCVLKEIGAEKHDCDVRFKSGSANMAVSCMRNASGHNYRNSLIIVDLAMGQTSRSAEHISSYR